MATQLIAQTERVNQFFNELESHKNSLTKCTDLFTTLSNHFSTAQNSISQKLQTLDSKFQSLESRSKETLESLNNQEDSIPERESSAAARIDEQKEAALDDLRNSVPLSTLNISDALKSLSRKMDANALLRFVVSKRKESVMLRPEIVVAIKEAVDPPRLVLDAVEEYLKSKTEAKSGVTDKRWACGLLIQGLISESSVYSRRIVERAAGLVDLWKEQLDGEPEKGAAEVVMFLQIVACFGLREKLDDEYVRKSVMEFASRRDMAKVAASLEFGDKMIDIIDELVKNGKEIEAVYFASESGLTKRFQPIKLLESYVRNYKSNAASILANGNNSHAATDESTTLELNSIKDVIKCVEDHKLESEFRLDEVKKRASQLEKSRAERRKTSIFGSSRSFVSGSGVGSGSKSRKRGSRGSGSSSSRPAKSVRTSVYPSSYSRRNLAPIHPSPSPRYSAPLHYPSQTMLENSTAANHYAATYGNSISQSPAGIGIAQQQHYSYPVDNNLGPSNYLSSSSYAGQTSYGVYDYGSAAAPPTYPYTVDQTSYRG
ncbi:unnamed protein product [Vicia faba]|uniref:FRIGIDA-like protein n=1 Tax=Vicia faba TaxID=3906 RepID=A0AAV1BB21_VICFA|nr:unnamed protein product [Vicia faba]